MSQSSKNGDIPRLSNEYDGILWIIHKRKINNKSKNRGNVMSKIYKEPNKNWNKNNNKCTI